MRDELKTEKTELIAKLKTEKTELIARDNTRIAVHTAGSKTAPPLVLANGLGGNQVTWKHLIEYFAKNYRVITWDYRGLYESGPSMADDQDYGVQRHVEDLEDLLEKFEIKSAVFVGWSMGVQCLLEFYRQNPAVVKALVLVNGAPGRPFETAFGTDWFDSLIRPALSLLQKSTPVMSTVGSAAVKTNILISLAKAVGFVSPTLDDDVFGALARDWVKLDFFAYSQIFRAIGEHSARDVLSTITVPTLIITGDHDLFTPVELSKNMAESIDGAEILVVRGASHYTPIEFPLVVNLRIEKFLHERLSDGLIDGNDA